jgi:hypothetical protein
VEQVCSGAFGTSCGERCRERCGRVNMVQILCTHVYKRKMRPVETVPGMEGRGIKENDGGC